jgi:hypothetical protein
MRAERCLCHIVPVHQHLVVPGAQVKLSEELRTPEFIEEFFNHRDRKLVLHHLLVERSVIDA